MPRTDMMKEKGLTLVDAINEALYQEMERDERPSSPIPEGLKARFILHGEPSVA